MRREYVLTSVVSAVIGAGLMLFAVGGGKPAGIDGWVPVNQEVASALQQSGGSENITGTSSKVSAMNNGTNPAHADEQGAPGGGTVTGTGSTAGIAEDSSAHSAADKTTAPAKKDGLISINNAGAAELQEVPGIGEKKAQSIINYRNEHGVFHSVDDLTKVKGIGDKMLEKMKPYIGL